MKKHIELYRLVRGNLAQIVGFHSCFEPKTIEIFALLFQLFSNYFKYFHTAAQCFTHINKTLHISTATTRMTSDYYRYFIPENKGKLIMTPVTAVQSKMEQL